jgi:hypothetical protein
MIVLIDNTRCHDEACTKHHLASSLLVGDASYSTDQLGGSEHGQVKPAIMSSKDPPENRAISKAEYTNTQESLPDYWYILCRLLNMQGFWLEGFVFAKK